MTDKIQGLRQCEKCGNVLPVDSGFCNKCGDKLPPITSVMSGGWTGGSSGGEVSPVRRGVGGGRGVLLLLWL